MTPEELLAVRAIKKVLQERQWIPVSERLPELKDGGVLVYFAETKSIGTVNILDYFRPITAGLDAEGNQKYTLWAHSRHVTHWMDLPDPPKEGSAE